MAFSFRPAVRENVPLLIGLAGGTGSGKTYTAMRLAKGLAGGRKFAVIDSEAGRAKAYADTFSFDHGDLTPPFRPDRYLEAIVAADNAGYPAIVVDSMSHEHAGDGGLLDWHEEILTRKAGDDWQKRERMTMSAWIEPKQAHKRMVQRLLQLRAHLILCFRAEAKIEIATVNGKTVIREKASLVGYKGWIPIAEKSLPFELTVSFMLLAETPGIPYPIKLQEQHRALFPANQPITEEAGARLAAWAKGGAAATPAKASTSAPSPEPEQGREPDDDPAADWLVTVGDANTEQELAEVGSRLRAADMPDAILTRVRSAYEARLRALRARARA